MRYALLASILLLGGCAAMSQTACGGGIPPRIDTYAYQCSRQNVEVSTADYMNGWWIGNAAYRDRTAGSESN